MRRPPRVLVIAGSDSGGGAGIQADLKTIAAFGGFATTAVTAVTAQDTHGVGGVWPVPPEAVALQIAMGLADIGADAVKTGMLVDAATIEAVAAALSSCAAPLVCDPVMAAGGGGDLLADDAVDCLRARLLPAATLFTPNLPEAARMTGLAVTDLAGMRRAAEALRRQGARAVLIKGGHLEGATVCDLLLWEQGERLFAAPRIEAGARHGTGCTLASAIAAGLARGDGLLAAVERARAYVRAAMAPGLGLGGGRRPLDHGGVGVW